VVAEFSTLHGDFWLLASGLWIFLIVRVFDS
jgi:hypothetical protein